MNIETDIHAELAKDFPGARLTHEPLLPAPCRAFPSRAAVAISPSPTASWPHEQLAEALAGVRAVEKLLAEVTHLLIGRVPKVDNPVRSQTSEGVFGRLRRVAAELTEATATMREMIAEIRKEL